MDFSKENVEKSIQEAREAHDNYRTSGLGLSALIITLSGASLYRTSEGTYKSSFWFLFLFPIVLALIHQAANFIGGLYNGKRLYYRSEFNSYGFFREKDGMVEADKKARSLSTSANHWFSFSEYLCISAVCSYVLILLALLWKELGCIRPLCFAMSLAAVLITCWICRKKDLFSNSYDSK